METKKRQTMRFSDEELKLLNDTFSEREDLLFVLRKFLLQGELKEREKEGLKRLTEPRIFKIIKKTYIPELDFETPLLQMTDLWMAISTKQVEEKDFELASSSWKMMIDYLNERFEAMTGGYTTISFSDLNYSDQRGRRENLIKLAARNSLIFHIDQNTNQLFLLAGERKETLEETKERLLRNSNK